MGDRLPDTDAEPLILLDEACVPWHVVGDPELPEPLVYARGYATLSGRPLENETLAQRIQHSASRGADALRREIPDLNGGWAIVVVWPTGHVLAAVDRMRCVPLFFYHTASRFAIAASATELARRFSLPLSVEEQVKFLLFGYVSGCGTLYENVRQVQPGEIIEYRPQTSQIASNRYYRFYPTAEPFSQKADLNAALADAIQGVFERFRDGYRGERVAIPLSGGLDSRLIAGMLKRLGVENCLCYTYGDESHEEVRISRQVAEALGFRWRCLPHTPAAVERFGIADQFREYRAFAWKGVTAPVAHDFAAVVQLAAEGVRGAETIYFPGHSADMNAGSHIPPDYEDLYSGKLSVVEEILRHHARPAWYEPKQMLWSSSARDIVPQIQQEAAQPVGSDDFDPLACCEMWNAENRQAKYIINNVRAYEFVGARWRTLWDYGFMDFFLRVPTELRYGQRLYLECLLSKIFVDDLSALADIPVAKHGSLKTLESVRMPPRRSSALGSARGAFRSRLRWVALKFGLTNPVADEDRLIRTIIGWCGMDAVDPSISFEEALERAGALGRLQPEIRDALMPWLKMRVDSVPGFAVYTALVLAEHS